MKLSIKNLKNTVFITLSLLFIVLILNICVASNVIISNSANISETSSPVSVHNDSSFESSMINESTEVDLEEATKKYLEEVSKAYESVKLPEVYNLPTMYTQPTYHPSSDCVFGKVSDDAPIFSVDLSKEDPKYQNMMCLTFDSAYINKYTYQILDELDKYNAKATFFMTYEFMVKNPDQIKEIIRRGHEIGNHSTTHPDLNKERDTTVVKEIMKAHNYIVNLVGIEMCLFRFPFGSYSPRTVTLIKNMGYYPIQWTYDSIDWKNLGKEKLLARILESEHVHGGSIILFHNGATYTPEALPEILDFIYNEKGLRCVRVSDMIYTHDFHIMSGMQIKGQYKPNEPEVDETMNNELEIEELKNNQFEK